MTSLWRKIRSTLKKNRKEKPGKFRGEETMLMYITTSEMLEEERMQEILRADTKKERRLCLFCKKDDTFSFEDVAGAASGSKENGNPAKMLCFERRYAFTDWYDGSSEKEL